MSTRPNHRCAPIKSGPTQRSKDCGGGGDLNAILANGQVIIRVAGRGDRSSCRLPPPKFALASKPYFPPLSANAAVVAEMLLNCLLSVVEAPIAHQPQYSVRRARWAASSSAVTP